jgi:hypothetical protein
MRSQLLYLVALLAAGILVVACDTADPSECFPNTGNGFGGSGTIPIGAGVGVSSGAGDSPRFGPLGYTDANNPCNAPPDDGTTELSERVCGKPVWGMGCQTQCAGDGVACVAGRPHPKKSDGGFGLLWKCCGCQDQQKCTYFYPNTGDSCTFYGPLFLNLYSLCVYQGGM